MKYNSNSGFIDNEFCRKTPQAFSHFTFERSGHERIVVDIQGVGDLYTDPQIHTATGTEYGDGKRIQSFPAGQSQFPVLLDNFGIYSFDGHRTEMYGLEEGTDH